MIQVVIGFFLSIFFQGSLKYFPTLASLIVHHSVMCELLPCPLLLEEEHHNPGFQERRVDNLQQQQHQQQTVADSRDRDFADLDLADYPDLMFTLRKAFGSSADLGSGSESELPSAVSPTSLSEISSNASSVWSFQDERKSGPNLTKRHEMCAHCQNRRRTASTVQNLSFTRSWL